MPPDPIQVCDHCGRRCLLATDYVTGETVLLDAAPVRGGRVEVKSPPLTRQALVAIDHITRPAPQQPAHELHSRTCPNAPVPVPVDLSDDPVREQTGGWRR